MYSLLLLGRLVEESMKSGDIPCETATCGPYEVPPWHDLTRWGWYQSVYLYYVIDAHWCSTFWDFRDVHLNGTIDQNSQQEVG
jgi:hypothetical protein